MTPHIPGTLIYPEPTFVCLTRDTVEIPCSCAAAAAAVARGGGPQEPGVTTRALTAADVATASSFFEAGMDPANPGPEACLVRAGAGGLEVAGASRGAFRNASQLIEQLVVGDPSGTRVRLRGCVVLDSPHLEVRAVRLSSLRVGQLRLCGKLVRLMARLKYNTLSVASGFDELGAPAAAELADACCERKIMLVNDADVSRGVIDGLDGPAALDWEHRSRAPGVRGAAVVLNGGLSPDEMAASGFLFNLAFAATMLSCGDYNNFQWEKVQELVLSQMPSLMGLLGDGSTLAGEDIVPLGSRPGAAAVGGRQERTLFTGIGERVDGFIFQHLIRPAAVTAAAGETAPRRIGEYIVRYADGEEVEVPLVENLTIGSEAVWCGRRLDPWTHAFQTDPRLRSLACGTRPLKRVSADGRLRLSYELAWPNPRPTQTVEEIRIRLDGLEGAAEVVVEQVSMACGRNHDRV